MYQIIDEDGKIIGHTRWPNHQTNEKINQESSEWIEYIDRALGKATLDELRESKKSELRLACEAAITTPFQSSALGSAHSYDCEDRHQANLQRMVIVGSGGSIWAHDGTEFLEKTHTSGEAAQALVDMQDHEQTCRFGSLKPKIAQVNAITEDTPANRILLAAITW